MSFWDDPTFIEGPKMPASPLTEAALDEVLAEINRSVVGSRRPFTFTPATPEHKAWFCERHPEVDICHDQ